MIKQKPQRKTITSFAAFSVWEPPQADDGSPIVIAENLYCSLNQVGQAYSINFLAARSWCLITLSNCCVSCKRLR